MYFVGTEQGERYLGIFKKPKAAVQVKTLGVGDEFLIDFEVQEFDQAAADGGDNSGAADWDNSGGASWNEFSGNATKDEAAANGSSTDPALEPTPTALEPNHTETSGNATKAAATGDESDHDDEEIKEKRWIARIIDHPAVPENMIAAVVTRRDEDYRTIHASEQWGGVDNTVSMDGVISVQADTTDLKRKLRSLMQWRSLSPEFRQWTIGANLSCPDEIVRDISDGFIPAIQSIMSLFGKS